jgi:hypothetical protein
MKPIKPLYVLILVVIFAAAGFYGGTVFQKSQTRASFARGAGGQFGARFGAGGPGGAGMMPVRGQIVSSGDNTITVKMQDGSSKIVDLTSQTMINKTATGTTSDLKSGTTVTAIGTSNSDGSVTAQTVLIGNGMFRMRTGGNQGGPTGSQ